MTASTLGMPTGLAPLDAVLPLGGWPVAGLTEIAIPSAGMGELRLLTPVLRRLTQAGRTVALLVPPYLSYAPTLIQHGVDLKHIRVVRSATALECLASIESSLQEADFAAVVAWMPIATAHAANAIRMLQLAARLSHCPVFLFCTGQAMDSTPAHLASTQLQLQIKSQPGTDVQVQRIDAPPSQALPVFTLDLPAPLARVRTVQAPPAEGIAKSVLDNNQGPHAPLSARPSLRSSLAQIAAALSPVRVAEFASASGGVAMPNRVAAHADPVPARSSWPFKQRRRTPETPSLPLPTRARRFN